MERHTISIEHSDDEHFINIKQKNIACNGVTVIVKAEDFADMKKAIDFEIIRENSLLENGRPIRDQTRMWDPRRRITVPVK